MGGRGVAMEMRVPCHSAGCGQRAVSASCVGCGWRYCGEHLLRASFVGPQVPRVVLNVCQQCVEFVVQQQHARGLELSQWSKVG